MKISNVSYIEDDLNKRLLDISTGKGTGHGDWMCHIMMLYDGYVELTNDWASYEDALYVEDGSRESYLEKLPFMPIEISVSEVHS